MKHIESLAVKYHQEKVGTLSLSADGKVCTFEYDNQWLASGFSISPLELPLKPGLFIAKATPFNGNFGIFEDSLPDGLGLPHPRHKPSCGQRQSGIRERKTVLLR